MAVNRMRLRKRSESPQELRPAKLRHTRSNRRSSVVGQSTTREKNPEQPCTPPHTHSPAINDTPLRQNSSHPCSVPKQLPQSAQTRAVMETLSATASEDAQKRHKSGNEPRRTRNEMTDILRIEIAGAVYEYAPLCEEFLCMDGLLVDETLENITENSLLWRQGEEWIIDTTHLTVENDDMHNDCANLLDMIVDAAFRPDQFRPSKQTIVPSSRRQMLADHVVDADTSPDIVQGALGEGDTRHWGDLEFFAECKDSTHKLQDALMQIARYLRAMLSHQIYQQHVYSVAFCGTQATFVRISRGNIIHSPPIDLEKHATEFVRAVAGLFTLEDSNFGYNTRFYYWPPLANQRDKTQRQLRVQTGTMRWIVIEILCHRMCVIGRATVVLLLRRVNDPGHCAVLKLIWRPTTRIDESESLKRFAGKPGVCQCRWSDSGEDTNVRRPELLKPSTVQHHFFPLTKQDDQELSGSGLRQHGSMVSKLKRQRIRQHADADVRHLSMILMDEGVNLWRIKTFTHVLRVLRDAIVGYASVALDGKVHRDISAGNILCLPCNRPYFSEQLWAKGDGSPDLDGTSPTTTVLDGSRNRYEFGHLVPPRKEVKLPEALSFEEYTKLRYAEQPPVGGLFDFEFMVPEARDQSEVRSLSDRTGTIAFMSSQVLLATKAVPVVHSFLHNIESFYWVFLWVLYREGKVSKHLDPQAEEEFDKLFLTSADTSGAFKQLILVKPQRLMKPLLANPLWDSWDQTKQFIRSFHEFLHKHIYHSTEGMASADDMWEGEEQTDPTQLPRPTMNNEEKWRVFRELIDIFDNAIINSQ